MLVLAILGLLSLASITIPITNAFKPSIPRAWTIALTSTTIAWLAILLMRLFLPTEVNLITWNPSNLFQGNLNLTLDYQSWPYAVALITLCMATLFTDTTRTNLSRTAIGWSGAIAVCVINLVGILAGNPLTVAIGWSLVDLVELSYLVYLSSDGEISSLIRTYAFRLFSLLTLVTATVVGWQTLPNFDLHQIPANASWIFLLAAAFRLGILPTRLPATVIPEINQGITVFLRFASATSALVLISHLNEFPVIQNPSQLNFVTVLTALIALYSSLMFATRASKFQSRPYWVVTLSAFVIFCALHGFAETSKVWGLTLVLSGGLLYLFEPAIRRIRFLPLLGLIGLVGLPYTLAASGWSGLLGITTKPSIVILIISHALLVGGFLRYIFEANTAITALEKHARITYPLGMVLILQTIFVLGIVGWPGVLTIGQWWLPASSLGLVSLAIIGFRRLGLKLPFSTLEQRIPSYRFLQAVLTWVENFFSLGWLFNGVEFIAFQVAKVTNAISELLEGEGGVLWSLVFLFALITFFVGGVSKP